MPRLRSEVALVVFASLTACGRVDRVDHAAPRVGKTCGGCHERERAQWEGSMHHASFSSRDFQASFREEPLSFCVGCHAPHDPEVGVGCESCHPRAAEHERTRGTAGAETAPCAGCHDFDSPRGRAFLQATEREHRESGYADVPCVECHMASSAGGRDHRFSVTRDAARLGAAIAIDGVRRERDSDRVVVTLRSVGVGHRFPTGDIFRQLLVRAWVEDDGGKILADRELALHRDWDASRQGRPEAADTRLGDAPVDVEVQLGSPGSPASPASRVFVTVDYQRGFEARGGELGLFSSLRIAERTFPIRQ